MKKTAGKEKTLPVLEGLQNTGVAGCFWLDNMPEKKAKFENITVSGINETERLDRYLREIRPDWGRNAIDAMINARQVTVNGKLIWMGSWKVKNGDEIRIQNPPGSKPSPFTVFDPAWVIAETEEWIVVNKPEGLLSHVTWDKQRLGLLELVREHYGNETALFHRLDRDTSGIVILTRTANVNKYLDSVFKQRLVEKEYLAVVHAPNQLRPEGEISARLLSVPNHYSKMMVVKRGGQTAWTIYKVLFSESERHLVLLRPITGRTHQLRVHMQFMGAPILGDRLYGLKDKSPRLLLHAYRIYLPDWEGYQMGEFQAPLPEDFLKSLSEPMRDYCVSTIDKVD
ncbi:MAG: RluA family pseudouridine synthase [Anaerolineales bacterium]|nr:RluA family pseudouridine synthase [Anaerolineales bacterium]